MTLGIICISSGCQRSQIIVGFQDLRHWTSQVFKLLLLFLFDCWERAGLYFFQFFLLIFCYQGYFDFNLTPLHCLSLPSHESLPSSALGETWLEYCDPAWPGSPTSQSLGYPLLSSPALPCSESTGDAVKLQTCSRHSSLTLLGAARLACWVRHSTCCSPADSSSVQLNSRLVRHRSDWSQVKSLETVTNYWGPDLWDESISKIKLSHRNIQAYSLPSWHKSVSD